MLYNTMRFCADSFDLPVAFLYCRINGRDCRIPLYPSPTKPAVALQTADGTFYAQLVTPSDPDASPVYIRIKGTNYSLKG